MKYILLFLALIAMRSPLFSQTPAQAKAQTKLFFVHSNAKDAEKYKALFAESVNQYFLVSATTPEGVYSKAWAWFKKNPDEHYAPAWQTFTLKSGVAEITVEYYRDGVAIKPYKIRFEFTEDALIKTVMMQSL